jgi:hypothetical protein
MKPLLQACYGMSPHHSGNGKTSVTLAIVAAILAASLGAYYLSTSPVLARQGQSISSLQSTVSSLVANPVTSTITTLVQSTTTMTKSLTVTATQLSTTTAVRTQTVVTQSNYTITDTATETETTTTTTTIANRTIPWYGLVYLSADPGCTVSSGVTSYPGVCSSYSDPVLFNCAAAAATPKGCTQVVDITGTTNQNFTVTVWYPDNSGRPGQNCDWTQLLPPPFESYLVNAYCIPVNSTTFLVSEPVSGPV